MLPARRPHPGPAFCGLTLLCAALAHCQRDPTPRPTALRPDAGPARPAPSPSSPPSPPSVEPREARRGEDPVVFAYRAALWARLAPAERARLDGVETGGARPGRRGLLEQRLADRAVRALAPAAFEGAGDSAAAVALRALGPVRDRRSCGIARDLLTTVAGRALSADRTASAGAAPSRALAAAARAAGHAGNACAWATRGNRAAPETNASGCDDDAALVASGACRAAVRASAVGAFAAGAAGAALAAQSTPAAREGVLVAAVGILGELAAAAASPATTR